MMDTISSDEETDEQQKDSQFRGAASIISTDGMLSSHVERLIFQNL